MTYFFGGFESSLDFNLELAYLFRHICFDYARLEQSDNLPIYFKCLRLTFK